MMHKSPMFKSFDRNACRALEIALVVALAASVADAQPRYYGRDSYLRGGRAFDGEWSVLIQPERGPCGGGSYRYGVDIVNGAVIYQGTPYGRVAPNGNVQVRLSLGDQHAEGVGRLSRVAGSGIWRGASPSGVCTGRWFAQRRDETLGAGR